MSLPASPGEPVSHIYQIRQGFPMPGIFLQWAHSTSHWVSLVLRGHTQGSYRVSKSVSSHAAVGGRSQESTWLVFGSLLAMYRSIRGRIHSNCISVKSHVKLNPLTNSARAVCSCEYEWETLLAVCQCIYQLQIVAHLPCIRLCTHVYKFQILWLTNEPIHFLNFKETISHF